MRIVFTLEFERSLFLNSFVYRRTSFLPHVKVYLYSTIFLARPFKPEGSIRKFFP